MTSPQGALLPGTNLPLVLEPLSGRLGGRDLARYIDAHRDDIERQLFRYGAILFRGFEVTGAGEFSEAADSFHGNSMEYFGGSVPRGRITDRVFNATELTRVFRINLHNELAYQKNYPDRVLFYCHQPSQTGGETFIADMRSVYRALPGSLVDQFERRQVRYVRVYQDRRPLREKFKKYAFFYQHLTWQDAMQAESREQADARCRALGMDYLWRDNGDLEVWNILPATKRHPVTGETCWFNQVLMQNVNRYTYGTTAYAIRKLMYGNARDMPNNSYFGDGEMIPLPVLRQIYKAGNAHTVAFPWSKGDVMLLDNHLVAHGRNPFRGDRKIMVSMLQLPQIYQTADQPMACKYG